MKRREFLGSVGATIVGSVVPIEVHPQNSIDRVMLPHLRAKHAHLKLLLSGTYGKFPVERGDNPIVTNDKLAELFTEMCELRQEIRRHVG